MSRLLVRTAPALGLFFLAPMSAEYLIGYDNNVGRPGVLLAGLLILGPLYGGPALIIREVTRRTGRGWPTIVLLATAVGVLQAGLIDQSLFNPSYRDIDSWDESRNPTFVPALGFSVYMALTFVLWHTIWSISAPIAIVESLVPRRAGTPWLGNVGLTVTAILYLLAAGVIFFDHVNTEQFVAPTPQLIGAAVVMLVLILAAFAIRPGSPLATGPAAAPKAWLVGIGALVAFSAYGLLPTDWPSVAGAVAILATTAILIVWLSRRPGWSAAHRLAIAGAALLSSAWVAFLVEPLGDPPLANKLGHNIFFALGVVALLALGARSLRRERHSTSQQVVEHPM